MKNLLLHHFKISFSFSNRKIIEPQPFTTQKVDDYYLVNSRTYQFVIKKLPQKHEIYRHQIQTPSGVLKKPGIHILPKQIPEINKRQKYQAILRKITDNYQKSFKNCQTPQEIFHMNRKVNMDIRRRLEFIGVVQDKYKHYMMYKSYFDILKEKTKEQYLKKGVNVNCLGFTIYPKGQVWMPTNQKYLVDFIEALKRLQGDITIEHILDIGCGSGVLSFLCKKSFKKAKVIALDINEAAVDTCNITAASNNLKDIRAFQFDVTQQKQFVQKIKQQKLPQLYDIITINPPWLHAKRLPNQSQLQGGVYDQNGKMLQSSLKLASQHLKNKTSKIFLIYSDLNKILGLQTKSVEQICKQNSLLINNLKERPLTVKIDKPSPLNQFKQKAKIQLFEIRKS